MAHLNDPFLIDPSRGLELSCGELLLRVQAHQGRVVPILKAVRLEDIFEEIITSLAHRKDIILLDSDFSDDEIARLLGTDAGMVNRSDASGPSRNFDTIESLIDAVASATDTRLGFYTSGTTGLPKRVDHSLGRLLLNVRRGPKHVQDVWGFAWNPTHIAGVQVFLQALLNLNLLINLFSLEGMAACAAIEEHGITHISATPTYYRLLAASGRPLPGVRQVAVGGERSDATLFDRLRMVFPNARIRNIYASTEAGTLFLSDGDSFRIPPELVERVRFTDNRIQLHPDLIGGFHGASRFTNDGWYDTGDVVAFDPADHSRFKIVRRASDLLNVGGYKVDPSEVEDVLRTVEGVRDARVFGKANSVLGTIVCAEIICTSHRLDELSLRTALANRLQPHKIPRLITFVDTLPTTRTGKIERVCKT